MVRGSFGINKAESTIHLLMQASTSGGNTPLIQWVSLQQLLGSKPAFKSTLPLINVGGILSTQPLITWGEITNKIYVYSKTQPLNCGSVKQI